MLVILLPACLSPLLMGEGFSAFPTILYVSPVLPVEFSLYLYWM